MSISLELRGICRTYVKDNESFLAVDNVNLTVSPGEFLTFLGPSGCGKTTTLRMIAGFEIPSSGQTLLRCRPISATWDLSFRTMRFSLT